MDRTTNGKKIVAGYALAAATLCLGFYIGTQVGRDDVGTLFIRGFMLLAAAIVLNFTFALGRLRGFDVRREDGSIEVTNLLRNVVAAAIVFLGIVFLSGPFIGALLRGAR